jgi:hypothetical protein
MGQFLAKGQFLNFKNKSNSPNFDLDPASFQITMGVALGATLCRSHIRFLKCE